VIRALHVTHPFKDANGRLHGQILLNRFLLEQGFDITILPEQGLGVFGGAYSIDELTDMVRRGFTSKAQLARYH
jgi:prophage maintenance system killer protein